MKRKVLLLFALLVSTTMAWAETISGSCGDGVTYELEGDFDSNYTLTISYSGSGTGKMTDYVDYPDQRAPWFVYRNGILSITINEGVTSIGNNAFLGCAKAPINIPKSVASIGDSAFQGCYIASFTFAKDTQLASIGNYAFKDCTYLSSFTCWATSAPSLGTDVFTGCNSGLKIYKLNGASGYDAGNWVAWETQLTDISNAWRTGSCVAVLEGTALTISGTGAMADYDNSNPGPWGTDITSVNIEDGVTHIGIYSFYNSNNLFTANIGNGVETIGMGAFSLCRNLSSITFGSSLKKIGANGVRTDGNGLTSIIIPASVTTIDDRAFGNCYGLTTVTSLATTPPTMGINVFGDDADLTTINVPGGSIDEYSAAIGWFDYASEIKGFVVGNNVSSGSFAGYWSTYYNSGCAVTVDDDTQLYYISAIGEGKATLTENTTDKEITAGQAVLLKSSNANVTMTYSEAASSHDYSSNKLVGVDAETTISTSDYSGKYIYTLAYENSTLGFYQYYSPSYTTNTTLAANKVFLALNQTASAHAFSFVFENVTDINSVLCKQSVARNQSAGLRGLSYYNLDGRKLYGMPSKAGLYIVNGKKVFIK